MTLLKSIETRVLDFSMRGQRRAGGAHTSLLESRTMRALKEESRPPKGWKAEKRATNDVGGRIHRFTG